MGQAQTMKKIYESIKKVMPFKSKEDHYNNNGAILLEYLVRASEGRGTGANELKIFSNKEIEKATDYYNDPHLFTFQTRENAKIYKANLDKDRVMSVAVFTSLDPNPDYNKLILNGVSKKMVLNHDNILKIYGCCLETNIPLIVCEYILDGGILLQYLHSDKPPKCLTWRDYISLMTETAYALSYMHNALPKPLIHRNLSSSCIFIDSSNRAKLAGFGNSVSITPGDKSKKWVVQGTIGYIDPEYIETQILTDKCDVYSFGVVMIEILTRRQPLMMARDGVSLVDVFVSAVEENRMKDMIDSKVLNEASWDEIQQVVRLALACVAEKGINRPNIIDVVCELWKIQGRDKK